MCYSGNCKYEQYNGDCYLKVYPNDALCVIDGLYIELYETKNKTLALMNINHSDESVRSISKSILEGKT